MFNTPDKWKSENSLAYLLLLTTTLCWGCNAVFARLAVGEVSPMLLVSIRWMATMLLLLLFFGKNLFKLLKFLFRYLGFVKYSS